MDPKVQVLLNGVALSVRRRPGNRAGAGSVPVSARRRLRVRGFRSG